MQLLWWLVLQIILLSFQCECKWHRQNVPLLCGKLILVSILILQPSLGANGCGSGWFMFRCWIRLINVFKMGLETGLGCTYYYCRSSIGAHWSRSGNTIMWTSGAAISSLISAQPVPSIFPFTMAIQQTNNSNNIICIINNIIYCIKIFVDKIKKKYFNEIKNNSSATR